MFISYGTVRQAFAGSVGSVANKETSIQNAALLAVGAEPGVMVWRNQTGVFRAMDDPARIIKVGNPGAPDVLGVVAVTITPAMVGQIVGVAIGPEFKTVRGRQSDKQKAWAAAFEKRGGRYRLIRSPDEMREFIEAVKRGEA